MTVSNIGRGSCMDCATMGSNSLTSSLVLLTALLRGVALFVSETYRHKNPLRADASRHCFDLVQDKIERRILHHVADARQHNQRCPWHRCRERPRMDFGRNRVVA